jgi:periplasmic protein CpxP/Spy
MRHRREQQARKNQQTGQFMKINKTSLITILTGALLVTGTTLRAQDAPDKDAKPADKPHKQMGPGEGGGQQDRMAKMAEELKLTDDQKAKVKTATQEQMEKMRAIRSDDSLTQEQKREKGKALRDEMTAKMKEILTPEQFTQWEKMRPQPGQRPGGPGGQGGGQGKQGGQKKAGGEKTTDATK